MSMLPVQSLYSGGALVCAALGCVFDVRQHRVPNLLSGPALLAGLVVHGVMGGWSQAGEAGLAGLLGGGVFVLFYLAGGMGAGDVKLMAAVGCWLGLAPLGMMLVATALSGSLLGIVVALRKRQLRQTLSNMVSLLAHHRDAGLTPHPELNVNNPAMLRLPFAVPIAVGCLVTACAGMWGG